MKQKKLNKAFMMIFNELLVAMVYKNIFQRCKGCLN